MAVKAALEKFPSDMPIMILSDSQYVVKGMNEWRHVWVKRHWKTVKGEPIKNLDLWKDLTECHRARKRKALYGWVRGHQGNQMNELADRLANAKAQALARRLR